MNIILTGFMGTGKTSVGRRLAKRLGWRFTDVDELIESGAGVSIAEIFSKRGEPVFRRLEQRHLSRVMRGDHQVIATGGGAFIDPENARRLKACGTVVCLTAQPKAIASRLGRRLARRPLLQGAPNPLGRIKALLAARAKAYAQADLTVATDELTVEQVVERLWERLSPCVCPSWDYVLEHTKELSARYAGQYVAIVGERVVVSGDTQLEAYQRLPHRRGSQTEAGIYYIPLPQESVTAFLFQRACWV